MFDYYSGGILMAAGLRSMKCPLSVRLIIARELSAYAAATRDRLSLSGAMYKLCKRVSRWMAAYTK
jgi:hypothetical protein